MAEDMETILRKSLDAVDRSQRWQVAGLVFFLLFLLIHLSAFITITHEGHDVQAASARAVAMGIFSVVLTVAACTFGITFFISRMTKRILKAIELSSKP
ncbi:MAG TPA: hypothetical protein VMB02_08805 [Candidatus Aquilonibacter sp.]|nr:hypothetical protein [Candidatus Aquilonibacter sp.]